MAGLESVQLMLPIAIRAPREVSWFNARQTESRRLLGKRVLTEFIFEEPGGPVKKATIDVDSITDLNDVNLRYALRFADAARASGWQQDGPYTSSGHFVWVKATDEAADSQLLRATYSGIVRGQDDTFMDNLHRFAPDNDENY